MTQKQFHKAVGERCVLHGGIAGNDGHTPCWRVTTPNHGVLRITPIDDWIAMRFETFSTGKVYDTLFRREFNGYSGKWNIHMSGGDSIADIYRESVRALERSLEAVMKAKE